MGKDIYRVFLSIRDRDDKKKVYSYTYILPCGNIMAARLRAGKGGETVNWFWGSEKDDWYNGGEK